MPKNRYHRILSDVNIIRCRKTDITEFCLRFISYYAEKQLSGELWVGHRIDPLPGHACRKRRVRQGQPGRRIKGLA